MERNEKSLEFNNNYIYKKQETVKMANISKSVGNQIRFFRKQKGLSLQDMADSISKSRATVYKYESGDITVDVQTLYEIAEKLGIHMEQLLCALPAENSEKIDNNVPAFFRGLSQVFLYAYDGRIGTVCLGLIDILSQIEPNAYKIMLYLNFKDYNRYQNCENTYWGVCRHYDALTRFEFQHSCHPMEHGMILALAPHRDENTKWAMFTCLSTRPLMPCSFKMLLSKKPLPKAEELTKMLMISKDDIRKLKMYNMFTVTG